LLFAPGSAVLASASANRVTAALLPLLRGARGDIVIEGHTDDVPIATGIFPSNWELSAARSAAVVRALELQGVAATRLAALGYGDSRPAQSNGTAAGRAENRRVVVKVRQQGFDSSGLAALAKPVVGAAEDAAGNEAPGNAATAPASTAPASTVPAATRTPALQEPLAAEDEVQDEQWLENIDPAILQQILREMDEQEGAPNR